ncbi:MAG: FliM/FliN family flagellar motor switch protein [Paracoccaceae bacterium]
MTENSSLTAMRRKAGEGRPAPEVQAMSAAKALRLSLARAAEEMAGLVISVKEFEELRMTLSALPESLPENALHTMIQAEDGATGLVSMDVQLIAGLIEQLTTGNVRHSEADTRAATPTDAIIASELIDRVLGLFEETVREAAVPPNVGGYRYVAPFSEPRAIGLTLEDIRYRYYRLVLDLGGGAKTGVLLLMMPLQRPRASAGAGGAAEARADWSEKLEQSVCGAEAPMTAVLHRMDMSLLEVMGLEVGALIPVPRKSLGKVRLEGADGALVSYARLGQSTGNRAVRIRGDIEDGEEESSEEMRSVAPSMAALPDGLKEMGAGLDGLSDAPSTGGLGAAEGGELPALDGGLPPLGDGGLPPLGDGGLPPLGDGGLAPLGDGGLPPLGDGGLPPLGDGGLPPLGEGGLPPLGDGGLPPLGDGGLPPLGDGGLPPLGEGGLPPLGDGGLPPLTIE